MMQQAGKEPFPGGNSSSSSAENSLAPVLTRACSSGQDRREPYFSPSSRPLLTRKTWPSGWRRCISRTFHGSLVGGMVISRPAPTQALCISSTSSTHTDIHTPLSASSSPSRVNVVVLEPLPRPPCAPWQRKMQASPEPTAPKVGGVPQSQSFFQPHFSNHAKLAAMSETLRMGVMALASIWFSARRIARSDVSYRERKFTSARCRSDNRRSEVRKTGMQPYLATGKSKQFARRNADVNPGPHETE
jgi:hypothetical protein